MNTDQDFKVLNVKTLLNSPDLKFSLDKNDSNFSTNQMILNSLIGTLVKYGTSGLIEPYLAESWETSKDKKVWKFKIRKGLFSEDGEEITAELFYQSLLSSFEEYSKKTSVITFDYLLGWDDFKNGKSKSIEGLKVNGNYIELHFNKYPDDLLELLRMPYFGLWKLSKENQIISTASYELEKFKGAEVILKLRENWFTSSKDSFKKVVISFTSTFNNNEIEDNTIIQMPFYSDTAIEVKNSYWIHRPPTVLDTFVLSPYKTNFFHNPTNRKVFLRKIRELSGSLIKSSDFYPSAPAPAYTYSENESYIIDTNTQPLTFILERRNLNKDEIKNLNNILNYALQESGIDYKIIHSDLMDKEVMKRIQSNNFYDARITSVDTGGHPIYTAIKMMFCTKMGISFPGHEEEFCNLIESNLEAGKEMNQEFIDTFNISLINNAVIIPIAHHSPKWLVSNNLDPVSLPATTSYPQFEKLKTK